MDPQTRIAELEAALAVARRDCDTLRARVRRFELYGRDMTWKIERLMALDTEKHRGFA